MRRTEPKTASGNSAASPPVLPEVEPVALPQPELERLEDRAKLDKYEAMVADTLLGDDEDEPGAADEISQLIVVKKLPRFSHFRTAPTVFNLFGTVEEAGMDELVLCTTKSFAPNFEADVELRRVRFFETVTTDGVIRFVYCFVPPKGERVPNRWQTSKLAALELGQTCWATMRSRPKMGQWTYRPSRKDHGEPQFSGISASQFLAGLDRLGLLVVNMDHPFYKKATDNEE
jgi:hypothetical protein